MWLQFQLPDTESFMEEQGGGATEWVLQERAADSFNMQVQLLVCGPTWLRMTDKVPSGLFCGYT